MKKTLTFALILLLAACVLVIPVFADTETSTAMYAKGGIIIDGTAEDKWDAAEAQEITVPGDANGEGVGGYTKIMWDEDYLYILAVVSDDTIDPEIDKEMDFANGDKVCFFVSETNARGEGYSEDGDYGVMISPWGNLSEVYLGNSRILTEMEHAETIGTDTYTIEVAIPWFTPGFEAEAGKVIGYNGTFDNDLDGDCTRDSWIAWVEWQDKPYWAATQWLGNVELVKPAKEYAYPGSGETGNLLVGTVIGNEMGWGDNADRGASAVFDGNPETFFDPPAKGGDNYCGMQFDSPKVLEKVCVLSRGFDADWNERFDGATIDGSNDGVTWVPLWQSETVGTYPEYYVITDFNADNTGYTMFRYHNEKNHGDIAELEFYGTDAPAPAETVEETPAPAETVGETVVEAVEETVTVSEPTTAPQTFDVGIIAAVAAVISLAGVSVAKKH